MWAPSLARTLWQHHSFSGQKMQGHDFSGCVVAWETPRLPLLIYFLFPGKAIWGFSELCISQSLCERKKKLKKGYFQFSDLWENQGKGIFRSPTSVSTCYCEDQNSWWLLGRFVLRLRVEVPMSTAGPGGWPVLTYFASQICLSLRPLQLISD